MTSSFPLFEESIPWSITELSNALKRHVESQFGMIRVKGEISGYRGPHSSGHVYFSLKDSTARLEAVIWKGVFGRLASKPQEGLEVVATGKLTTFPGKSSYQIIIEHLEPAGRGALMAILEERRQRLLQEGLFETSRKRPLPFLPRRLGVITSPTGAVIRDILHRLYERFPCPLLLWPVRVQGDSCAAEVTHALQGFNALPLQGEGPLRPDIIIIARGGGSLEDLWGFNEESVVRAAAQSCVPLISAIGHETDWTLLDHVADLRAPTPTAAIELCLPVRSALIEKINDVERRGLQSLKRKLKIENTTLSMYTQALPSRESLLAIPAQRLDYWSEKLQDHGRWGLHKRAYLCQDLAQRLVFRSPYAEFARLRERFQNVRKHLEMIRMMVCRTRYETLHRTHHHFEQAYRMRLHKLSDRFLLDRQKTQAMQERLILAFTRERQRRRVLVQNLYQLLHSLSYKTSLKRGFAFIRNAQGKPLRSIHETFVGASLILEVQDGQIHASVDALSPS